MLLFGMSFAFSASIPAASISIMHSKEYKTKARFLFNIAKFTTWPEGILPKNAPFELCIANPDPFGLILELLAIRGVNDHLVKIKRIETVAQSKGCHLVFLGKEAITTTDLDLANMRSPNILLIGETPSATNGGAAASVIETEGKVVLDINIEAAKQAGLVFDTQLLRLGRKVTSLQKGSSKP